MNSVYEELFKLNEKFKETLCLKYNASIAKSTYKEKGVFINESFLETEIKWNSVFDIKDETFLKNIAEECLVLKQKTKEMGGRMTMPVWEFYNEVPLLVWAHFFSS